MQPLDIVRLKALRDAVICIGWIKIFSVICYGILWFLVHANCYGDWCTVLLYMIVAIVPFQIMHGLLLFIGALEHKTSSLEIGLWMCLLIAPYNTVLGVLGCVYFIRTGYLTMHFLLALIFAMIALSLMNVICHDIIIIHAYKKTLKCGPSPERQEVI